MSIPEENKSSHSSSSSSHSSSGSSHHHHHHHSKKKHMDSSDRFKQAGFSSIKRRKFLSQLTYWLLVLAAIAVIFALVYVYMYTPKVHYR